MIAETAIGCGFRWVRSRTITTNHNLHLGDVHLRTPLVDDKFFLGLAGSVESRDGYTRNDFLDEDADDHQALSGRVQMRWTPSDDLDIIAGIDGERMEDGAYPLGNLAGLREDPHHVAYDQEGNYDRDTMSASLRVAYDAPWFHLASISAFRNFEDSASNDQDFTAFPLITANEAIDDEQITQEFRIASPENESGLEWLAGLYGFKKTNHNRLDLSFAADVVLPGMPVDQHTDSATPVNQGAWGLK
jgi:iron complex outermembrane receptor protein